MIEYIIIGLLSAILVAICSIIYVKYKFHKKIIGRIDILNNNFGKFNLGHHMSFEECNTVINAVVEEVYNHKYGLYYKLKEMTIIPNMDEEIMAMTKEVLESFSESQYREFNRYYTKEYIARLITRKIQIKLIDYVGNNKPNVG